MLKQLSYYHSVLYMTEIQYGVPRKTKSYDHIMRKAAKLFSSTDTCKNQKLRSLECHCMAGNRHACKLLYSLSLQTININHIDAFNGYHKLNFKHYKLCK